MPDSAGRLRVATAFLLALFIIGADATAQVRLFNNAPWQAPLRQQDSANSGAWWVTPLASALVPGTGQLMRGQDRGAFYLVAEAFLLQRFISLWAQANKEEDLYRNLALKVARAPFAPSMRDTVFEYFEQMGRYGQSGPYDTDPGPRLVPPVDEGTYNGNIWALARRTFFTANTTPPDTSIAYQSALAFYRSHAIGPNYQWSWEQAAIEQDLFRQTIKQGDDTFRQATQQLGLLLANHFISAVDALVSERLSRSGRRVAISHQLWFPGRQSWAGGGDQSGAGVRMVVEIGF